MTQPPDEIDPARPDPMVGRIIANNFRLERLLGAGGMGNVYRAEQLSLGKPVAVKILHEDLMADEVVVKRFEREARSASRLEHPNLVQIIDYGQDRGTGALYIAMELLTGRDLGQVITQDAPLPLHRIVRIMSQVFSALEEAHLQGIIHRDLKPANIMLVDRRGEQDLVKVCDFGIAKSSAFSTGSNTSMLTVRGFVCGTPEYMAPEQARGEDVDGRTDLYAAAVILYQMLTGQVPFTASSPVAILSQHLDRAPTPPSRKRSDISPALDALVMSGLAKDPAVRPQTASTFRQSLEAVCSISAQGAPLARDRTPTLSAVARTAAPAESSRWRWGHLAVLGGLMVTVGVGAVAALRNHAMFADRGSMLVPAAGSQVVPVSAAGAIAPAGGPVAAPSVPAPAATARAPVGGTTSTRENPAARHRPNLRASARPVARGALETAIAPGDPLPAPATAPESTPPTAHQLLIDAERLLSQGEITQACARGEEARVLGPRVAAIHRFLGKCYLRSGNAAKASDRYRTYLQLSPDASDAAFIKSLVR
jgi:tRNA A-37 threonylcarbamoyl transferase component Bud32